MPWPILKWSPDDKFVARVTPGQMISVHELPNMYLHGKKSLKIEGVVDFEWCPLGDKEREEMEKEARSTVDGSTNKSSKKNRENMLVYWTPEVANQPARVTLLSFPSRTILRQKNLFNVTEVISKLSCFAETDPGRIVQTLLAKSGRLSLCQGRSAYQDEEINILQPGNFQNARKRFSGGSY